MIEIVKCPTCGAPTQVLVIGASDHTTCVKGHPVTWVRPTKKKEITDG